ncbi:MAG: glycosyltransferase [Thermoanaerobaculum sp.]
MRLGPPPTPLSAVPPQVTVIIVNFNGRHHLRRCLASLVKTRGVVFETLVVDNGSSDGSVAWLEENHPWVRVVSLPRNVGFGAANTYGLSLARAPLVAFLNNDTVVHPNWLEVLVATLEKHPEVVAACATLRLLSHPQLLNARGGGMTWLGYGFDRAFGYPVAAFRDAPPMEDVLFPTAAACLVRKDDFAKLGGFDPAFFMYNEDVDFGWRVWLSGKRCVVCRDSLVWHAFGGTTGHTGGARLRYLLGSRHLVRTVLKNDDAKHIPRVLWGLYKTWWRQRALGVALHVTFWNLRHLPSTLLLRRRVNRFRVRSSRSLLAQGLIAEAPFPPPSPHLPSPENPEKLVPSGVLLPGQDSARGRLGYGWYARAQAKGVSFLETTGEAACWLKVEPWTQGTVTVTVRQPVARAFQEKMEIQVNGQWHALPPPGPLWETFDLPARADGRGLVRVVFRAPEVVPHHVANNWDFRPLGLHVASVRFAPAPPNPLPPSPKVSVVIPTFNRWAVLQLTLEALSNQTLHGFQVIVVDDGSSDGTAEHLRQWQRHADPPFELRFIRQNNQGPAAARNAGVRDASGDLVVFLGDDTIPEKDFLQAHLDAHSKVSGPCAVVGQTLWDETRMKVTPFLRYVNMEGAQFAYGLFADGEEMTFTCLYTSNVSIPRGLLDPSPFHPAFTRAAWEDAELGYRLCRQGVRIVYCARARTHHLHPLTLGRFLARQRVVGQELETLLELHPELAEDPVIPPPSPDRRIRMWTALAPMVRPLAEASDALGIRLPRQLYRLLLLWAFYRGRKLAKA